MAAGVRRELSLTGSRFDRAASNLKIRTNLPPEELQQQLLDPSESFYSARQPANQHQTNQELLLYRNASTQHSRSHCCGSVGQQRFCAHDLLNSLSREDKQLIVTNIVFFLVCKVIDGGFKPIPRAAFSLSMM